MPQTTDGFSMKNAKIEFSTDGLAWTDGSGHSNGIAWDGGERDTEGTTTFLGDKRILTQGKKGIATVTAKVVCTEGAADIAIAAQAAYDNGTPFYLRWSPRGGASGQKMYTTDAGIVKKPVIPQGESGSAAACLADIVLETPGITPSAVA